MARAAHTEGPRAAGDPVAPKRRGARPTASGYGSASLPRSSSGFGGAIAFSASVLLMLVALISVPTAPDTSAYPVAALTSIPKGDGTLARYEWGGWLIWSGVPVFVDGRLTPYSGAVLDDYRRIIAAAPGWQEALARRGVRTLLVVPTDPVATRAIELGWPIRARSADFIVIAVP